MNSKLIARESSKQAGQPVQKWRIRLEQELAHVEEFDGWDEDRWQQHLKQTKILSNNYDTVVSLDWPHYCGSATEGCGGASGWCYTLSGQLGGANKRSRRAAMTDSLARSFPHLFADAAYREIRSLVIRGKIPYANLRFSGSGEVHSSHINALQLLKEKGVNLWGFSKNLRICEKLREKKISVIFSCDSTTPIDVLESAIERRLPLAYTSTGIEDYPPQGSIVTFPVHRSGKVKEVVMTDTVCPKIEEEYMMGKRSPAACQLVCTRCHQTS